jgi:hypothetical protein
LVDHLNALERLISPFADQDSRLKELREIIERRNRQAHATLFWRSPARVQQPSIPSAATAALCRLISSRISQTRIADPSRRAGSLLQINRN